jgi:hypothetical protein
MCPLGTTIYHAITTNSPRFNHQKTPQKGKPPLQKRTFTTPKNIPTSFTKNPPVRLDP